MSFKQSFARRSNHFAKTALFLLSCLFINSLFLPPPLAQKTQYAAAGKLPASKSARIKAVEDTLTPYVAVDNLAGWNIYERMKLYDVPGVSVAVIHNYEIDWAKGYGFSDRNLKKPVTPETMFSAGSISKPLAALTALKMVEDGKIKLDAPVNDYLVSWKIPENDFTKKTPVTLRMLLSHTAGTTQHGFWGYLPGQALPTALQTLNGQAPAQSRPIVVNSAPNTNFRYSGGGYMAAQTALTDVSKKSFPALAEETIFAPLRMKNTTFVQPLPAKFREKASYAFSDQPWYKGEPYVYPESAAAGLYSTPTDLAKFVIELQNALRGAKSKVINRQTAQTMLTAVKTDIEPGFYRTDMSLGNFLFQRTDNKDARSGVYFTHSGLNAGFIAEFFGSLVNGNGVVVMINKDDASGLVKEIIRSVARVYGWTNYLPDEVKTVKLSEKELARYVGRYRRGDDEVLTFTAEKGFLLEKGVNWKVGITAHPIGNNTFVFTDFNLKGTFQTDENGNANGLKFEFSEDVLPRIGADELVPAELLKIGRYAEAIEGYRKLKINENQLTYMAYTLILGKPANVTGGLELAQLAIELYPQSAMAHQRAAEAYEVSGDRRRAVEYYRKTAELDPQNAEVKEKLKSLEKTEK